jgi:hypothetical protein
MYDALLLDIGFVIIDVTWTAVRRLREGHRDGPRGPEPADRDADARWRAYLAGVISPDQYWGQVAKSRGSTA